MDSLHGKLIPACGQQEKPFTVNGRRWLYCWHPKSGKHCYLDLDTDIAVWNRSFHPAFAPDLEFEDEAKPQPKTKLVAKYEFENLYF